METQRDWTLVPYSDRARRLIELTNRLGSPPTELLTIGRAPTEALRRASKQEENEALWNGLEQEETEARWTIQDAFIVYIYI